MPQQLEDRTVTASACRAGSGSLPGVSRCAEQPAYSLDGIVLVAGSPQTACTSPCRRLCPAMESRERVAMASRSLALCLELLVSHSRWHHGLVNRSPLSTPSVVVTALVGCGVGALLAWRLFPSQLAWTDTHSLEWQGTAALAVHLFNAALVLACALAAVYLRFRTASRLQDGLFRVGLGLVAGGVASLTPTVAYAASVEYSNEYVQVITEIAIAVMCCTVGLTVGTYSWRHGVKASSGPAQPEV